MKTVAVIRARGRGSTLKRKNMCLINEHPLLCHFLDEMVKAKCLNVIFVWSEGDDIAAVCTLYPNVCHLERPLEMVYPPMNKTEELAQADSITKGIVNEMGCWPEVIFDLNCNEILLEASTVDAMFDVLMENGNVSKIQAIYHIDPNVYLRHKGRLFPVLTTQGVDRQDQPELVRMAYVSAKHNKRLKDMSKITQPFFIPSYEAFDFQCEHQIPYAEYMLERRAYNAEHRSHISQ